MQEGRLSEISESLESAYAEHRNWDFLKDNPKFWFKLLIDARHNDRFNTIRKDDNTPPSQLFQIDEKRQRLPLILLDAEKKPLFGKPPEEIDISFKPILHNNEVVGYVGLLPPKEFLHPKQKEFLSQQKSALILAVFGMILVVVIFSLPIAKHLTRPIKSLTIATRELASGNYAIRVPAASSDELGQLASDFNSMASAIEKYERARRQWIADISHELRTPLSVLRGEIEALLEGIRKTTPEAIRSLNAEVLRLNRLVEDLYQLALSDVGALNYHKEELVLSDVLIDSIDLYREEFLRKGIKLTTNVPEETGLFVFADGERLHQLFVNLLENSLKYTESGGEVVVRLFKQNNQAVVEIEDSAPGVPREDLTKLFDRLYRVEGSRSRATGGAGLGLAICKNIVEAHGGSISAYASPLGGLLIRTALLVVRENP